MLSACAACPLLMGVPVYHRCVVEDEPDSSHRNPIFGLAVAAVILCAVGTWGFLTGRSNAGLWRLYGNDYRAGNWSLLEWTGLAALVVGILLLIVALVIGVLRER
jgi:hypothetical protein